MPSPKIRAVVLDAVGTLIHPHPLASIVYAEVGKRYGSRWSPEAIAGRFAAAFQREEEQDYASNLRTSETREEERWRRIVAAVLDDVHDPGACFAELYHHFSRPDAWRCDPEATATLKILADRGYLLGMASNYDRRLRSVVAGLPELQPIRHLFISSEIGWRKPAPEFFDILCQRLGVPGNQVLFVGDDPSNDYDGARAAGLRAVLFDPKNRAATSIVRIERLSNLLDLSTLLEE